MNTFALLYQNSCTKLLTVAMKPILRQVEMGED